MIENIKKMIELDKISSDETIGFFMNVMGKDVLVEYFLKGYADGGAIYKAEKEKLIKEYNFDWRRVSKELWSNNGCNAIYENLKSRQ